MASNTEKQLERTELIEEVPSKVCLSRRILAPLGSILSSGSGPWPFLNDRLQETGDKGKSNIPGLYSFLSGRQGTASLTCLSKRAFDFCDSP